MLILYLFHTEIYLKKWKTVYSRKSYSILYRQFGFSYDSFVSDIRIVYKCYLVNEALSNHTTRNAIQQYAILC